MVNLRSTYKSIFDNGAHSHTQGYSASNIFKLLSIAEDMCVCVCTHINIHTKAGIIVA